MLKNLMGHKLSKKEFEAAKPIDKDSNFDSHVIRHTVKFCDSALGVNSFARFLMGTIVEGGVCRGYHLRKSKHLVPVKIQKHGI